MATTLKNYIFASMAPRIMALKNWLDEVVKHMTANIDHTNDISQKAQMCVVSDRGEAARIAGEVFSLKQDFTKLKEQAITRDEIAQLKNRVLQLEYICSCLYAKVQATDPEAELPDYTNPKLPDIYH